ncbi:MAG: hypothetical protein U9R32_01495 [Bacteroidota bacterium]|nr:hypothetical protein [Bacteroidota bacterium]
MKNFLAEHIYSVAFIILGIIGGFFYWKYVGCTSGSCAIKSNWYTMIFFGGLIGYLIGDTIDSFINRKKKNE